MWTTQTSAVSRATPEAVWNLWQTSNWTKWDPALEWVRLDGAFQAGTRGELKPKGGPKTKFTVLRVDPNRGFADRSHLPLTHLDFTHEVVPLENGTVKITHTVTFSGPLAFLFSRIIGKGIKAGLPDALQKLAALAEGGGGLSLAGIQDSLPSVSQVYGFPSTRVDVKRLAAWFGRWRGYRRHSLRVAA